MTAQDLKNSILQQAMQGKLVPQDPSDEPASELIKKIKADKVRLIKEGKNRKEKPLLPMSIEEIPYDIPVNWEWERFGDIGPWASGATPSKSNNLFHDGGTIPWLVTGDLNDGVIEFIPNKITETALKQTSVKLNPENSVLMAMYGATIGKVGILSFPATTNQACCACQPFHGVDKWYLLYFLISQRTAFRNRGEGGAQPNISKEKIVETLFPLPSLSEQKRIVAKIEELLPLIERYDESDKRLLELNKKFPDDLRKAILQQAVQGKLTEQDPHDEPASELLKRIKVEKTRLIKEGKIKKEKPLPPISDDEIPFDIPDGWKWVRLASIGFSQTGNTPSTSNPEYFGDDLPFITPGDILDGIICYNNRALSRIGKTVGRCCAPETILQVCIGGSIGKAAITKKEVAFNQQINSLSPILCESSYIHLAVSSGYFVYTMKEKAGGTATPIINRGVWDALLIPLPPFPEQKRIVEKVEEFLSVCDNLQ